MKDDDLIEKIAKEIWYGSPFPAGAYSWKDIHDKIKDQYRGYARVAIQQMKHLNVLNSIGLRQRNENAKESPEMDELRRKMGGKVSAMIERIRENNAKRVKEENKGTKPTMVRDLDNTHSNQ